MNFRAIRRMIALSFVLLLCIPRLWLYRLRGPLTLHRRAMWGHETGKQMMAAMGIRYKVSGKLPQRGLLVSNHLSYLDILVYGSIVPCFFVSKEEVSRWPFFGWMSRTGGTIYVERSGRANVATVLEQMGERFALPVMVLLFPEGTSTDGSELLQFRSRLFTPAIESGTAVTAAAIRYVADDGTAEREFCWFGDAEFLPHLIKALGGPNLTAEVRFGESKSYTERRVAASASYAEVAALRDTGGVIRGGLEACVVPAVRVAGTRSDPMASESADRQLVQ